MDKVSVNIWAKTSRVSDGKWHPLILHMLDVATSADAILAREPESTRNMMAAVLGMEWEDAKPWLLLLVACHDLGKACPGFQGKWLDMTGLRPSRSPNTDINHGFVSQIALTQLLQERDWPEDMAILVSDAVGCHHGNRPFLELISCCCQESQALPTGSVQMRNGFPSELPRIVGTCLAGSKKEEPKPTVHWMQSAGSHVPRFPPRRSHLKRCSVLNPGLCSSQSPWRLHNRGSQPSF